MKFRLHHILERNLFWEVYQQLKMKIFLLFLIVGFTSGAKLPDGTIKCHRSDPKAEECLVEAITDGIRRLSPGYKPLGIPSLDPLMIAELSSDTAGGLKQVLKNVKIEGIHNSTVTRVRFDWDALKMECDVLTKRSILSADYVISGKLLSFPLNSSGKCQIIFGDLMAYHKIEWEKFQKDGKDYVRAKDWKIKYEPKSIHFDFDNIMPGNKQLSETILQTINENSIQVFEEQSASIQEAYAVIAKLIGNKIFERIPVDELFLP